MTTSDQDRGARLSEAVRLREAGDCEPARDILLALSKAFPVDVEVAYQTAWVHDRLGLEADAVPFYERALTGDGLAGDDRRGAYLGLGSTFRTLGRYDESVDVLRRGVADFPEDGGLRTFLAMALYNTAEHHEAMQLLLGVLAATSTDPGVQKYRRAIEHYAQDLDAVE